MRRLVCFVITALTISCSKPDSRLRNEPTADLQAAIEAQLDVRLHKLASDLTASIDDKVRTAVAEAMQNAKAAEATRDTKAAEVASPTAPTVPEWYPAALRHRAEWARTQPDEIRADLTRWPLLDPNDLQVGQIGEFPAFPIGKMSQGMRTGILELSDKIRANEHVDEFDDKYRWWSYLQLTYEIGEYTVARQHNAVVMQVLSDTECLAYALDLSNTASEPAGFVPAIAGGISKALPPIFLLRGIEIPAIDRTDEKKTTLQISGPVHVAGTYSYVSKRGSDREIPVLTPVNPNDLVVWSKTATDD